LGEDLSAFFFSVLQGLIRYVFQEDFLFEGVGFFEGFVGEKARVFWEVFLQNFLSGTELPFLG
jgi:hypothetical protein